MSESMDNNNIVLLDNQLMNEARNEQHPNSTSVIVRESE
jgi:hypothetical protein